MAAAWVIAGVSVFAALCILLVELHERRPRDDGDEGDDDGGGGGRRRRPGPPPPLTDGGGPAWWPEFERDFAAYVDRLRTGAPR